MEVYVKTVKFADILIVVLENKFKKNNKKDKYKQEGEIMEIKRYETKQRMSRAVVHNNTVYLCGQVAKDTTKGIKDQTKTTLEKIEELLESVGTNKNNILSATIYIKDMAMFQDMNLIWDNWVNENFAPARACVQAKMAREEILIEISIIAGL